MFPMTGRGTLTFKDGTTADVVADVRFTVRKGTMSGAGTIRADDVFSLAMKGGLAVLSCSGRKIEVFITNASGDGVGTVRTSGAPF